MPSAAEDTPRHKSSQPSNLEFLYQRQRSRLQIREPLHSRSKSLQNHDLGRKDAYGEKLARLSPRELATSPHISSRYPASPYSVNTPLLSALGSTTSTAAQYTTEWAKSLPFFNSPSAGSNAGSPPSAAARDIGPNAFPLPSTPPNMRPSSHPNQVATFGGRLQSSPQNRDRRQSMHARYGASSPYGGYAPLPHQDQAHFHPGGLPDLDSLVSNGVPDTGLIPGEKGYYCGFDTLAASGHGASVVAENVLIVGYEGGVCVYRVTSKNVEIIGKLEGLKGGVIGAKILPWTSRKDPGSAARPYVALILHGPILDPDDMHTSTDGSAVLGSEEQDSPAPSTRPPSSKGPPEANEIIKRYRTTVEVYSLLTKEYVATLYTSNPVDVTFSSNGNIKVPEPLGDLTIAAQGKYLVVASGVSGEVLVFSPYLTRPDDTAMLESFRCIGKVWTSVQQRRAASEDEPSSTTEEPAFQQGIPIFSLSHRWLAVVPPSTSAAFSINGTAKLANSNPRPPGLLGSVPPTAPTTNVIVDTPDSGDFMGRLSREMMQGTLKAAQWVGKQSMQAWNAYWNQTQPQATVTNGSTSAADAAAQSFPPTHGYQGASSHHASDTLPQVAVYDLQRMLDAEEKKTKHALTPLGTFEPPSGCSFLSFSPNGLHLLTVSVKGDEQYLWSLMRLYKSRNYMNNEFTGQYVQQVWKSVRTTVATVVDVAWSAPLGNRLAILTGRGTIHVHEIPPSAYQWPLFRRAKRVKESHKFPNADEAKEPTSPDRRWGPTMKTINGTATWLRSVRTRSISAGTSIRDFTMTPAATAAAGGKVFKASLTKGIGALANSAGAMYHAGENKLHIENMPSDVKAGLMHFMTGRDAGSLAVVVGPAILICTVRQTTHVQQGRAPVVRAKISKRGKHFRLALIPDDLFPPAVAHAIQAKYGDGEVDKEPASLSGFWSLRAPRVGVTYQQQSTKFADNWHAQMEAETNPPYMPFHSDRRTTLYAFAEPKTPPPDMPGGDARGDDIEAYNAAFADWQATTLGPWLRATHHLDHDSSWAFGMEDPSAAAAAPERLTLGDVASASAHDDSGAEEAMQNEVRVVAGDGAADQLLVMTTVFRKGRPGAAADGADDDDDDDDFFEDDCEVLDWAGARV